MAEREKVRSYLAYEKDRRMELRRIQRTEKMIIKLERVCNFNFDSTQLLIYFIFFFYYFTNKFLLVNILFLV